jgi:hypothetical protein
MKPDLYTKTMLTVIAAALLLLVARSFQDPAPAFAQTKSGQATQAVQRVIQHVIVDNLPPEDPKHVIIDGVQHVILDDLGGSLSFQGVPVSLKGNGDPVGRKAVHVIVDDLDTMLSLRGLPVSLKDNALASPGVPGVRWRYDVDRSKCAFADLNPRSAAGWELFQFIMLNTGSDIGCVVIYRQPM